MKRIRVACMVHIVHENAEWYENRSRCITRRYHRGFEGENKRNGSISVSGQLPTYPSPNSTLTLTCCQLTVVELGEG